VLRSCVLLTGPWIFVHEDTKKVPMRDPPFETLFRWHYNY
jgi:hypothetical protein